MTLTTDGPTGGGSVEVQDRIVALDILRGLALFGMIFVHFHQKMESPATGTEDLIGWIAWVGFETKAWAVFALLFGAGFAILMRRAEARGQSVVPLYLRRMLALAIIGFAVQALTGFRILLDYAIWGLPLLLVRRWPTRWLLTLAVVSALAISIVDVTRSTIDIARFGEKGAAEVKAHRRQAFRESWQAIHVEDEAATYSGAVRARLAHARWIYSRPETYVPGANLVLFILGLLAVRHRVFEEPKRNLRVILGVMTFGLVSWASAWLVLRNLPDLSVRGISVSVSEGFGVVSDQWLAFAYAGAVILLLAYRPVWRSRLGIFGIAGRMALTNYVLQTIILSWLASGYGLSLKIRPYAEVPASIALFLTLAFLSRAWLSRFRYGPLEWLWRSVTYARWQSIAKPGEAVAVVPA